MEVSGGHWFGSASSASPVVAPILAVDASTDCAVVAIGLADGTALVAPPGESKRHGRGLIPAVRDLLRAAGLSPRDLTAIGVGLGPGSFTGTRIAVTAAKTLAYALGRPLYGFDSLEAMAGNAGAGALRIAVAVDAQRGDLFVADFQREAPGGSVVRTGLTRLERRDLWPPTLDAGTVVVGPALGRGEEPSWTAGVVRLGPESGRPDGVRMLGLTLAAAEVGPALDPWFLEPSYVRRSAAEEKAAGGPSPEPPLLPKEPAA